MDQHPFMFGLPVEGSYFTDREEDTRRLAANFRAGINTILISPRRWGKTSLVRKAVESVQSDKVKVVYLDIFPCRDQQDFLVRFASSVIRQTASRMEEWYENACNFLSRLVPKVAFGIEPGSEFSLSFGVDMRPELAEDVLDLPQRIASRKKIKLVVCIDEFQQIGEFRSSMMFQKQMRSVWQLQRDVSYCLFGSKQHMMNGLFVHSGMPFYKFGDLIYLRRIPVEHWVDFITSRFFSTGKSISAESAARICELVDSNSLYVQQLSWLIWTQTQEVVNHDSFESGWRMILEQNTPLFEKQLEDLTAIQLNLVRAIADGVTTRLSTKSVIDRYSLVNSPTVAAARNALIKKDIVQREDGRLGFVDPLFPRWIKWRQGFSF